MLYTSKDIMGKFKELKSGDLSYLRCGGIHIFDEKDIRRIKARIFFTEESLHKFEILNEIRRMANEHFKQKVGIGSFFVYSPFDPTFENVMHVYNKLKKGSNHEKEKIL